MAYLGKGLGSLTTANITVDKMTGNGSTATLTITLAQGVNSVNDISVFVSGVMQRPGTDYTLAGSTLTFTTAPATGLQVVAISHGDSVLDSVADATAITASFDSNSVPDSAIGSLASSKLTGALAGAATNLTGLNAAQLTGALPAVAATNLTNLTAANLTGAMPAINAANLTGVSSYTKSASDPATDTNPTAVGAVWVNSTSGETYVCTDATTDANVWTNVGAGTGDIPAPIPYQGSTTGYCAGGQQAGNQSYDRIDKWAFASAQGFTASDVGNIASAGGRMHCTGAHSGTDGFVISGNVGYTPTTSIEKYSHASDGNAILHGDVNVAHSGQPAGCSDMSAQKGHVLGGSSATGNSDSKREKFDFSSNTTATLSGDLVQACHNQAGNSSTTYGYAAGGHATGQGSSFITIQKFAFATDVISEVYSGVLTKNRGSTGCSSLTHGFAVGSYAIAAPTGPQSRIDKYSFASEADATTVGELTAVIQGNTSCSSTDYGWSMGGQPPATTDRIDRFAFASQGNSTDLGNLSLARVYASGTQV